MTTDEIYEDLKNADLSDNTKFRRIPTPDFILRAQKRLHSQSEVMQIHVLIRRKNIASKIQETLE